MGLLRWLKTKFSKTRVPSCYATTCELYHFGKEDAEKGVCADYEIGQLCSNEELKRRCIAAEKRDPERYRLGRFKETH